METYFSSQRSHTIIFKSFKLERLKTALPSLNGSFISEGGGLTSDIFEVSDLLKLKGLLLTVDIEKAFDSVNHNFLLKILENYGFSHDFLKWISILL